MRRGARPEVSPAVVPARCYVTIDESKRSNQPYIMVAAYVPAGEIAGLRAALRGLLFKGQRSLHFTKERDSTRKAVLAALQEHAVRAVVVEALRQRSRETPRNICLRQIAHHARDSRAQVLLLDRDDSLVQQDRRVLYAELHQVDITYDHRQRHEDELLWAADAIAWAYSKDNGWRSQVRDIVIEVIGPAV